MDLLRQLDENEKNLNPAKVEHANQKLAEAQGHLKTVKHENQPSEVDFPHTSSLRSIGPVEFRSKFGTNSLSRVSTGSDSHWTSGTSDCCKHHNYHDTEAESWRDLTHDDYKKLKMQRDPDSVMRAQFRGKEDRANWKSEGIKGAHEDKEFTKQVNILIAEKEEKAQKEERDKSQLNYLGNQRKAKNKAVEWMKKTELDARRKAQKEKRVKSQLNYLENKRKATEKVIDWMHQT